MAPSLLFGQQGRAFYLASPDEPTQGYFPEIPYKLMQSLIEGMIHYCQEDLVVIEFTGQGPRTRKDSKSEALAEDF